MIVHVRPDLDMARNGGGGVHHVSFRTASHEIFTQWNQYLASEGVRVTEEIDRFYFKAMYFREPGGVLYEISTDGPGFATDEDKDKMGSTVGTAAGIRPDARSYRADAAAAGHQFRARDHRVRRRGSRTPLTPNHRIIRNPN